MPTIAEIREQFPMYSDIPDGELVRGIHGKFYSDIPYQDFLRKIDFSQKVDQTKDMGGLERFNAGMGKAFVDIGKGAAQLFGKGPSAQEVADQKELDKPLMDTGAGMAGNIGGNVAAFAPLAMVPGANTVAGAGAIGGTVAALSPAKDAIERIKNMGIGALLGAGTQAVVGPGARMLGERAAEKEAEAAARQSQNAIRDQTLQEARSAGYVVPPSAVDSSFVNKRLESIAGKAAVGQEAAARNQAVTNRLARQALGLPEDAAISESALKALRNTASQPYKEVSSLSQQAAADLEALKQSRHDATAYFRHYSMSADPASLAKAKAAALESERLEQALEGAAKSGNRADLIDALRAARQQIAKTYEVEKALNVATGDVSAKALGRALDKGKPLSGELETIGKFSEAFPAYAREGASIPTPGVSKSEALASVLLALGGHAATGNPVGMVAGALPLASGPVRSLVLSNPYQKAMANPDYSVGLGTKAAAALEDPATRERLAMLVRSLALPAIPSAVDQ